MYITYASHTSNFCSVKQMVVTRKENSTEMFIAPMEVE